MNNKELQRQVEDEAIKAAGDLTIDDQITAYLDKRIKEEQERLGLQKLPFSRYADFYADCLRKIRADTRPSPIDKNGQFRDFLEVRRPFISPNNETAPN